MSDVERSRTRRRWNGATCGNQTSTFWGLSRGRTRFCSLRGRVYPHGGVSGVWAENMAAVPRQPDRDFPRLQGE